MPKGDERTVPLFDQFYDPITSYINQGYEIGGTL